MNKPQQPKGAVTRKGTVTITTIRARLRLIGLKLSFSRTVEQKE